MKARVLSLAKELTNATGAWGSGEELAGENLVDKCKICQNVSHKQLSDSAQIFTQILGHVITERSGELESAVKV